MALSDKRLRQRAYEQDHTLTPVDRFGVWLSSRRLRRSVPGFAGRRVADVGCGYNARFARTLLGEVKHLVVLDVALDPALKEDGRVTAIEGVLPGALAQIADDSLDMVVCNSVLEHLWEPSAVLVEFRRILAPGGTALLNVPSWKGKWFLEVAAFRLHLSPSDEMDDHKMYYDPRDLWPLLVRAGFLPHDIRCFRHKFGLNTFAVCRKALDAEGGRPSR
jgi:SAM-dependent methyltransferase